MPLLFVARYKILVKEKRISTSDCHNYATLKHILWNWTQWDLNLTPILFQLVLILGKNKKLYALRTLTEMTHKYTAVENPAITL